MDGAARRAAAGALSPADPEVELVASLVPFVRAYEPAGLVHTARPDSINNGADDDGSGSVALLEIAGALVAGPERPRRSILFVWHTAEEKGLVGSRWFTDHPTVPRDSIVAHLNIDHYEYDATGHPQNVYCRSDHAMYARYGIPVAFFTTGLHQDYHQVTDEPRYIDYGKMARLA